MADIESAIVTRLLATSAVTTIVDTRVEPVIINQTTELPCVTYQRTGGGPLNTMGGVSDTFNTLLQIDCWSTTYVVLAALAAAVRTALSGWSSTGSTPPVSGFHLIEEEDVPILPKSGESAPIFRRRLQFNIWHT